MPSQFPVHLVSEQEYREHLRTQKPYTSPYKHHFQIGVHHQFDGSTMLCRLYHNSNGILDLITGQDVRRFTPLNEYFEKSKKFYITQNGVDYYKVLYAHIDADGYLEMSIALIAGNTYTEANHFFMIMPFRFQELNAFYNEHIKNYLKKTSGIDVFRADDITDTDVISDTIMKQIEISEFVICDITHNNKNVFFEIGYAYALRKKMIFIMEGKVEHNFFDMAHIRRIEYALDDTDPFKRQLTGTIATMRSKM